MNLLLILLVAAALLLAGRVLIAAARRSRAASLVDASLTAEARSVLLAADAEQGRLARWLSLAGYRSDSAPAFFMAATLCGVALGLTAVLVMGRLRVAENMAEAVASFPGVGDALVLVSQGGPYILFLVLASAPTLVVRAARRSRVEKIEQDLAPTLELLATLAEAGLGLDSAIARIQESETGQRPLSLEFQIYQRDTLGGIPRLEALRKLARRIDVTAVSIFVSALIQAENVGASLSETLRTQADDLRDRRKLRALLLAQALPVKLVFPLIVCFLPGIFFSTLGPVISQLVDVVDMVIKRR